MKGKKKEEKSFKKKKENRFFFTHLLIDEVEATKKGVPFETLYSSPRKKADKVSLLGDSFAETRQKETKRFASRTKTKEVLKEMSSM